MVSFLPRCARAFLRLNYSIVGPPSRLVHLNVMYYPASYCVAKHVSGIP